MIVWMGRPFANDHLDKPAFCTWSSRLAGLLQMIIWMSRPLANDHPESPTFCKWSSGGAGLLQIITWHPCHPSQLCQDPDSISRTFLEQFVLVSTMWMQSKRGLQVHLDALLTPSMTPAWGNREFMRRGRGGAPSKWLLTFNNRQ